MCHCCANAPHHILGDTYQPACIILTDQCFPAALPATNSETRCPIIIRVEDGTLSDILASFRKTIGKVKLPVGTVILISSLSHLARVGTAAYVADLHATIRAIEEDYGNRVRAVHGMPILAENLDDGPTARALWDTLDWLENVDKRAKHMLPNSTYNLKELSLLAGETVGGLATARLHLRLPAGFRNSDQAAFMLGSCSRLGNKVSAISMEELPAAVATLIGELNEEFAVNLDPAPNLSAGSGTTSCKNPEDITILIAGSSHASRLANVLADSHPHLVDISVGGWKLNEDSAVEMAEEIGDHLSETTGKAAVIVQLFDNSIYFGKLPDGTRKEPFKEDGQYHVEGELDTISKERMRELFDIAAPVFRAAKNVPTFVLGPIPRYMTTSCCEEPDHVTNFEDADYAANIAGGVSALGRHLRQLVWHKRWKNVVVLNTPELMGIAGSYSVEEAAVRLRDVMVLWGTSDPVHPTTEAYRSLATAVLDVLRAKVLGTGDESSSTEHGGRGVKRPREERAGRRLDWMVASETAVSRRTMEGRGGHGGRGRGGGGHGDKSSPRDRDDRSRSRAPDRSGNSSYSYNYGSGSGFKRGRGGSGGRGGYGGQGRRGNW